jgi:hypothetical protein
MADNRNIVGYTGVGLAIVNGDVYFSSTDLIATLKNWITANPDDQSLENLLVEVVKIKNKYKKKPKK